VSPSSSSSPQAARPNSASAMATRRTDAFFIPVHLSNRWQLPESSS
jgi:hypothetical protein